MKNIHSNRGAIPFIVPVGVGVFLLCGYLYLKVFAPGRNTAVADKAAIAAAKTEQQAVDVQHETKAVQQAVAAVIKAHQELDSTHQTIEANASGFSYAAHATLLKEPNPSPVVKLATTLTESSYKALGESLSPEQKAIWDSLLAAHEDDKVAIANRDAKIAQMTTDAVAVHATLVAVTAHANASDATAVAAVKQLDKQTTALVVTSQVATKYTSANAKWADNAETLGDRIKALGGLSAILVLVAGYISIKLRGVTKTRDDAVALAHHGFSLAEKAGVAVKEEWDKWWGGDNKAKAAHEAVLSKLRLI